MINIRNFLRAIRLIPKASTEIDQQGEFEVLSTDGKARYHNGTSVSPLVTEAHTATLTNKSMDGGANTFTNLPGGAVGPGIDAANIADGSVSNTEFQYINSLTSNAQDQLDAKLTETLADGNIFIGDGSNLAVANPVTGDVSISNTGVVAITAGAIVNADINGSAAIDRTKIANGTADHVIINNGSGTLSSEAQLAPSRGGTGIDNTGGTLDFGNNTLALSTSGATSLTLPTTGTLATLAGAEALTNKTQITVDNLELNGNTLSSTDSNGNIVLDPNGTGQVSIESVTRLSEQASSPATPASGYAALYPKTDGFLYYKNDSGAETKIQSGSGGINYIINPDAEGGTQGWSAYADSPGVQPVNGTGGSPVTTITASSSSPLRGLQSFVITKDAADRQGEGVSVDLEIDPADVASVMTVEFDYQPSSGFVSGPSSDLRMWIYDITNSQLIGMNPYTIDGGGSVPSHFKAQFQTASNSLSYRLIFHIATTNASAWTFKMDNVSVGPQSVSSSLSDATVMYIKNSGSVTGTVGDSAFSGATDISFGATPNIDTHNGYSSGVYTIPVSGKYKVFGQIGLNATYSASHIALLGVFKNGTYYTSAGVHRIEAAITNSVYFLGESIVECVAGDTISLRAGTNGGSPSVDSGADSSYFGVSLISGSQIIGSGELVTFRASTTSVSVPNATVTAVTSVTVEDDTANGFSGGVYTVSRYGRYRLSMNMYNGGSLTANTGQLEGYFYVNGSAISYISNSIGQSTADGLSLSTNYILNVGDEVEFMAFQNNGASRLFAFDIALEKINSASDSNTLESINASYSQSAGQSIPNGSITIVDFAVKDFDSHSSVTTGASWKFTAPASGKYKINAQITYADNATGFRQILLYKNNVQTALFEGQQVAATVLQGFSIARTVHLNAGEFVDIRAQQGSGGSLALAASSVYNWISIDKVGN